MTSPLTRRCDVAGRFDSERRKHMAHPDTATLATLYQRLRRPPRAHSVAGSLPVLFFGDLFSAQITTVGINPSDQEYLDGQGSELDGAARRFETLSSLHASSRQTLTNAQCAQAIATMRSYFARSSTVYRWFRSLERVLVGMGYTYSKGQIAHLDLVQEATTPTWSALERLHRTEADNLLTDDLPFLQWQIAKFPLRAVICNGMTVFRSVCAPARSVRGNRQQQPCARDVVRHTRANERQNNHRGGLEHPSGAPDGAGESRRGDARPHAGGLYRAATTIRPISLNSPKRPATLHNNPAPMQGRRQIFGAFSDFLFGHEKKELAGALCIWPITCSHYRWAETRA